MFNVGCDDDSDTHDWSEPEDKNPDVLVLVDWLVGDASADVNRLDGGGSAANSGS